MIAVEHQHVAAGPLGFVEPAGAKMRHGGGKQIAGVVRRGRDVSAPAALRLFACRAPLLPVHGLIRGYDSAAASFAA